MKIPTLQKLGNPTRLAASAAVKATPGRVLAILLEGGTTATSVKFKDAASDTGTEIIGAAAPHTDSDASAKSSVFLDFSHFGGIYFATAIYAVLAGTGAICYVWYD